MTAPTYSSRNTVLTVAKREVQVLAKAKGTLITLALTLVIAVGGVFAANYFLNSDADARSTLAVVGTDAAPFTQANESLLRHENPGAGEGAGPIAPMGAHSGVEIMTVDSADAATAAARAGDIDAALIAEGQGKDARYRLVSDGTPDQTISTIVSTGLATAAQNHALSSVGVSPEDFAKAMPNSNFDTVDLSKERPSKANIGAVVTIMIGVSMMCFFIILFAANIGSRVTEEKSSRVVEIILATARPLDFLGGKLVGNTLVGFLCTAIILGSASLAIKATGLLNNFALDFSVLPIMLLSFLIGMLFFGSLYAAAGSMVSRTEDLQSTQSPIMLLIFGTMYGPIFGWSSLDSTIMQVLAWLPPFSLTVAPVQMAGGNMSNWEVLASFALALVVTLVVMIFVARIYRNAILHNGSKLSWLKALKGS